MRRNLGVVVVTGSGNGEPDVNEYCESSKVLCVGGTDPHDRIITLAKLAAREPECLFRRLRIMDRRIVLVFAFAGLVALSSTSSPYLSLEII